MGLVQSVRSTRELSWADEVEEMLDTNVQGSIWDNFDITKVTNVGFKFDYIAPEMHEEIPVCEETEDITTELDYWKKVVVCYVLGAHSPLSVLNGYVQRLWG